jgi:4-coumarate--CoA ligase
MGALYSLCFQHALVVVPKFDFNGFLSSLNKYSITHIWIVSPVGVLIAKHPASSRAKYKNIRYCMVGAAPLTAELEAQLNAMLPDDAAVGQGYGMTESSTVISMQPLDLPKGISGSAGRLITNCIGRVIKQDGSLGGIGEEGELVIKSPATELNYYLNNEQANKETFVDGWLRTGDEVYFDKVRFGSTVNQSLIES